MRLQVKIVLALTGILSLLGLLSVIFFLLVIRPSFLAIEEQGGIKDLQRVTHAIKNEIDHLSDLNHDWAAWDVTYDFMQTHASDYIEDNLPISSFTDNFLNLIAFYDVNGKVVWSEARDLETEELILIRDFSAVRLPPDHPLLRFAFATTPLEHLANKGIWPTEHGPMLISARPILTNENEGPARGTLVMGRLLNDTVLERLNEQVKISFAVVPTGSDAMSLLQREMYRQLSPDHPYAFDKTDGAELRMFTSLPFLTGNSKLLVAAVTKREILNQSTVVMSYTIASIVLSIITAMAGLFWLLHRIVIAPVASLSRHVSAMGQSGDLSSSFPVAGRDEIALLGKEFNTMASRLAAAKQRLQEQSFQVGMAELATGILHNVRNTLHKMYSNLEHIAKTVDTVPVEQISRACNELDTRADSEERKEELTGLLQSSVRSLLAFTARIKSQLDATTPLTAEIEHTLKCFEKWAYAEKAGEKTIIATRMLDAFSYLNRQHRDSVTLTVGEEVNDCCPVMVNPVMITQVLINLFTNAAESIQRVEGIRGEIRVHAETGEAADGRTVHLRICDNGAGIDPSVLRHIFAHRFSTKDQETNTGLGLHWCANAVRAMGGNLYAESDGPGRGACFHLILPCATPARDNNE